MPPFTFRLEQVRRYRKQLEDEAMQALAKALMERDGLVKRIEDMRTDLAAQEASLATPGDMSGAERHLVLAYAGALRHDIAVNRRALSTLEDIVDERRADLVEKAKDRGLLDSLKEKQAERHLLLERQQEQRTNDETATLRYKPAAV